MKLILTIIFGTFLMFSCQEKKSIKTNKLLVNESVNETPEQDIFFKVNLKNYIGKSVGELLKNNAIQNYNDYYWSDEPPGKLNSLNLVYPNKISLEIYAHQLKFTPSFSETLNFNIELFKKEKVTKIIIVKDSKEIIVK